MGPGLQPSTRTTRDESRSMRGSSDAISATAPRKSPPTRLRSPHTTTEGRGLADGSHYSPCSVFRRTPDVGPSARLGGVSAAALSEAAPPGPQPPRGTGGFSLKTGPLGTNTVVIHCNKGGVLLWGAGASLLPGESQVWALLASSKSWEEFVVVPAASSVYSENILTYRIYRSYICSCMAYRNYLGLSIFKKIGQLLERVPANSH